MGRPMILESRTYVKKVACCDLIITISFHEKTNTPYELFIKAAKKMTTDGKRRIKGGCDACHGGIAELTTYLLKNNLLNEAVDALEHVRCIACRDLSNRATTREEKKEVPFSCPDAIARVLKDWIEKESAKKNKK